MRNKKGLIASGLLGGIILANTCHADIISGPSYIDYQDPTREPLLSFIFWILTIAIEVFFGYLIFFRKKIKSLLTILSVNAISQPIATLTFFYVNELKAARSSGLGQLPSGEFKGSAFLLIELAVVIFEAAAYKFLLDGISYKKAIWISLLLNILSIFIGYLILSIFGPLLYFLY